LQRTGDGKLVGTVDGSDVGQVVGSGDGLPVGCPVGGGDGRGVGSQVWPIINGIYVGLGLGIGVGLLVGTLACPTQTIQHIQTFDNNIIFNF
jgi:hypothetical protein